VPGVLKVLLYLCPPLRLPLLIPPWPVAVCGLPSLFVQVTTLPAGMVTLRGLKFEPMLTATF
jgi:hypothetical protein